MLFPHNSFLWTPLSWCRCDSLGSCDVLCTSLSLCCYTIYTFVSPTRSWASWGQRPLIFCIKEPFISTPVPGHITKTWKCPLHEDNGSQSNMWEDGMEDKQIFYLVKYQTTILNLKEINLQSKNEMKQPFGTCSLKRNRKPPKLLGFLFKFCSLLIFISYTHCIFSSPSESQDLFLAQHYGSLSSSPR